MSWFICLFVCLFFVPSSIGYCRNHKILILCYRVWHDNTGATPSWFFSRMQVHDLQTNNKYFFILDRWLAVEHDDGMVRKKRGYAGESDEKRVKGVECG